MSINVGKAAIDFILKKSGTRKNIEIDLFGGEPLMNFEVVKAIVQYARDRENEFGKNIRFTMTTNATLLNEEIMDFIDKNMGNVVLSIDGRKEINDKIRTRWDGSGTYDDILPKINIEWNEWVIYSIINKWSTKYLVITSNNQLRAAEPLIIKKDLNVLTFEELIKIEQKKQIDVIELIS
jgi:sulfatase maturation enzyme AslB (radical SAM superfamily)